MNSSDPKPPNYTPLTKFAAQDVAATAAITKQQLDAARQAYAWEQRGAQTDRHFSRQVMKDDLANSEQDRKFYNQNIRPEIKGMVDDANTFNTPEKKQQMIGAATGDVASQFDAARNSAQQDLESYGINPGATRFAGLDVGMRTQEAAAKAAAGTQASNYVDETGRQLRGAAVAAGQNLPMQAVQEQTGGTQAGYGMSYSGDSAVSTGFGAMGTAPQFQQNFNQGLGNWANILSSSFSNQEQASKNSSGFGSLFGLAGGLLKGAGMFSGLGFAKGGAVPVDASPSGGAAVDDVPAKLTAGEFVIPEDAVRWMGEEKLHKIISKARQDRQGAIPESGGPDQPQHLAHGGPVMAHGSYNRMLQEMLAKRGYYTGKIDGIDGHLTHSAIQQFQADAGLKPTGAADAHTIALLKQLNDQKTPPTPTQRPTPAPLGGSASMSGGDQGASASGALDLSAPVTASGSAGAGAPPTSAAGALNIPSRPVDPRFSADFAGDSSDANRNSAAWWNKLGLGSTPAQAPANLQPALNKAASKAPGAPNFDGRYTSSSDPADGGALHNAIMQALSQKDGALPLR